MQVVEARRKFGGYKREAPKAIRAPKVKENRALAEAHRLYADFYDGERGRRDDLARGACYEEFVHASRLLEGADMSAKTITEFSITFDDCLLPEHKNKPHRYYEGIFISAMVKKAKEMDFVIHLTEDVRRIVGFIGYENEKNIRVYGDVGDSSFIRMSSGTVEILGHACGNLAEQMSGGRIVIHEDYWGHVSYCYIGHKMTGGEIRIKGKSNPQLELEPLVKRIEHGRVYYKGELIVDK